MFTMTVSPRFAETDALGHINNTTIPIWFEHAREPIFRFFTPDLDHKKWRLILARVEVDFVAELFYGEEVEVKSWIEKIGNSSMTIAQEVWQGDRMGAKGRAVMIHYDYGSKQSVHIPEPIRQQLQDHLVSL